jgi:hypothetical protein
VTDPIKLYLDEDTISRALIKALRARNVDLLSAYEADLISIPDHEHLEYATSLNRAVFTFNTRDYAKLHQQWISENRHHAGIIVSDQIYIGQIIRRLLRLMDARTAVDLRDSLEFLGNWR